LAVYIFQIKDIGMLKKMQRTGAGVCYTCRKNFEVNDFVVKASRHTGKNKTRRHIPCARKVGIQIREKDIPL
jgi:hypothetical protein